MVTIAFFKGKGTWRNALVRWWTRSKFSHCEVIFSDGTCFSAQKGVGVCVSRTIHDPQNWELMPWSCDHEQEQEMRRFAAEELGAPYDQKGIIFCQILDWGYESKVAWFCSEYVTAVLQQAGFLLRYDPPRVSPKRLHLLLAHHGGD